MFRAGLLSRKHVNVMNLNMGRGAQDINDCVRDIFSLKTFLVPVQLVDLVLITSKHSMSKLRLDDIRTDGRDPDV